MRRPDGTVYEYETEDKSLLVKKIKSIKSTDESLIEWSVHGNKVGSAAAVIEELEN